MNRQAASKFMVGILYLAAKHDCQDALADVVIELINHQKEISLRKLEDQFTERKSIIQTTEIEQHQLSEYNEFIQNHHGMYNND